jgi:plastocyanin
MLKLYGIKLLKIIINYMKNISTRTIIIAVVLLAGIAYLLFMKVPVSQIKNSPISSSTDVTNTNQASNTSTSVKPKTTVQPKVLSGHIYINIFSHTFDPKVVTVKAGTIITWTNKDSVIHTVTSDNLGATSPELLYGQSYSYKYSVKGIYGYHDYNSSTTTGTIIVN